MAPKLPILTPRKLIAILSKYGFKLLRSRGSHRMYSDGRHVVTIPYHTKPLKRGTLAAIVKDAEIDPDLFR